MSVITPEQPEAAIAPAVAESVPDEGPSAPTAVPVAPDGSDEDGDPGRTVNLTLVTIAAAMSCGAAAWLVSRLFLGAAVPLGTALLGTAIGVGLCWYSYRMERSSILQYAVLPISLVVGALLVAPDAHGGSSSLFSLVSEAIHGGGLLQPPVPFDPGWRLILVALFAVLGAGTLVMTVTFARPRLAIVFPLPVIAGAALLQPKGSEAVTTGVAMGLIIGALAVAGGSDIVAEGGAGSGFEIRRLARGAAMLLVLLVGVAGIARTDFLFPDTNHDQVIPAQRPPIPPQEADRLLFATASTRPGPWRVGVLDGQDSEGFFLLPPVDPRRYLTVGSDGSVPGDSTSAKTESVRFTIADLPGHVLPDPGYPLKVSGLHDEVQFDPRTATLRLVTSRVSSGLQYIIEMPVPPDAKVLNDAPPPEAAIGSEFEKVAPPSAAVQHILDQAPPSGFDRLQFVRQALYSKVVAAGQGTPVAMTPSRVAELLNGAEASPYEITAAEVMLARWAGFPARMGFGFYGGDKVGNEFQFRPKDGSAWLEVYFKGQGWVPILGTPPRAKQNIDNQPKKQDPKITATDVLAISVYVPVHQPTLRPFYDVTRYWALRVVPGGLGIVLVLAFYPGGFKWLRRVRRRRWAGSAGLLPRVLVAYAEFRDRCYDLNIGDVRSTPLEFLAALEPDDEHSELAWLVTRSLWGDLRRDLRPEDAEAAEEMARSLTRRLVREQPAINVAVSIGTRASLRDPYTDEVPNFWPQRRRRLRIRLRGRRSRVARRGVLRRVFAFLPVGSVIAIVVVLLGLAGCGSSSTAAGTSAPLGYPSRIIPDKVLAYDVSRVVAAEANFKKPGDLSLVSEGRVYSLRDDVSIQGSMQISVFNPDVNSHDREVQTGIESQLGSGTFHTVMFGTVRLREAYNSDLHFYVWFPPDHPVMEVFAIRRSVRDAEEIVRRVIAYQRGLDDLPSGDLGVLGPAFATPVPAPTLTPSPSPGATPSPTP